MADIFTLLKESDDKKAYAFFRELKVESEKSNIHYADFSLKNKIKNLREVTL